MGRRRPRGYTLLELTAASGLLAAVLVPSLALMRDAQQAATRCGEEADLTTFACGVMEEQLGLAAYEFTTGATGGDFAAVGRGDVRFTATRSDQAGSGGIADRLMAVRVDVWLDEDGDDVQDSAEPSVTLASKIAKLAVYEE